MVILHTVIQTSRRLGPFSHSVAPFEATNTNRDRSGLSRVGARRPISSLSWVKASSSRHLLFLLVVLLIFLGGGGSDRTTTADAAKVPDASSTLLSMHKLYTLQPPHDSTLYDILNVSPNATMAQITKSYRKLSRTYHPDKIMTTTTSTNANNKQTQKDDAKERLQQIQHCYQILKDDATRLLYHKYGLIDPSLAVVLLMGPQQQHTTSTTSISQSLNQRNSLELLQLMGYSPERSSTHIPKQLFQPPPPPPPPRRARNTSDNRRDMQNKVLLKKEAQRHEQQLRHKERVARLAAQLMERMRPLVEGSVDEQLMAHVVAEECDRLKTLPLGAQIIRCIGRAYRHAGQDYLVRHQHNKAEYSNSKNNNNGDEDQDGTAFGVYDAPTSTLLSVSSFITTPQKVATDMSVSVRQQWRQAKHYWSAALASGRVVWTEQQWTRQERKRQARKKQRRQQQQQQQQAMPHKDSSTPRRVLEYPELGDGLDFLNEDEVDSESDDENDLDWEEEEEAKELERLKAQKAVLQSMQVEALWQCCKIDLDQTVREACEMILQGGCFFFPSHSYNTVPSRGAGPPHYDSSPAEGDDATTIHGDGWITASSGQTIYEDVARLRAAAAMAMIGDIMVHCS